ncbi:MAG: methylmalonyl-CoA mutase, partial [Bdellovibrionota bacterium]
IVGLSVLSGAHLPLVTEIQRLMKSKDIIKPIFVGGIIPPDDAKQLLEQGVSAVFGPGSSINEIVEKVRKLVAE